MSERNGPQAEGTGSLKVVADDGTNASTDPPDKISVRDLLASYDRQVQDLLDRADASTTGGERVRLLYQVRSSIAVHDAVLEAALCPLLEDLPGGSEIAERLRQGCRERAALLVRFAKITKGVAAHNVYPVSGAEVEQILEDLDRSFGTHADEETANVGDVLVAAAKSIDPDVVAARMSLEADAAPSRSHSRSTEHLRSTRLRRMYHRMDRAANWVDAHHGWTESAATHRSTRTLQVEQLKRLSSASPTVRDLLALQDATVRSVIEEFEAARTDLERDEAADRMTAAIMVHDSVLEGVVCPLLDAMPERAASALRLRQGCRQRAGLLRAWHELTNGVSKEDLDTAQRTEIATTLGSLIESFHVHEGQETDDVGALLERLKDGAYRTWHSQLDDVMWPWRSEGPELLALRMALWAETAPTRVHPLVAKHPSSHVLKSLARLSDIWTGRTEDSALKRWLKPESSSRR